VFRGLNQELRGTRSVTTGYSIVATTWSDIAKLTRASQVPSRLEGPESMRMSQVFDAPSRRLQPASTVLARRSHTDTARRSEAEPR
jgi:hypothetical protein